MNLTKLSRGLSSAIASICGVFTFLHASTVPSSASTAFTTPTFISALPITPMESHGVTLAFGTGDYLYVLLSDGAQVEKFDVNFVQQPFTGTGNGGGAGSGANQFGASTTGIAVYRGGVGNANPTYDKIIAADRVNNRIKVLDQYGNLLFQFGTNGTGKGQFDGTITSVDVDQTTGEIYVLDGLGYARVQKFDSSGNFERMWGWGVATGAAQFEICTSLDSV
jgi:hypothetical protein